MQKGKKRKICTLDKAQCGGQKFRSFSGILPQNAYRFPCDIPLTRQRCDFPAGLRPALLFGCGTCATTPAPRWGAIRG